MSDLKEAAESVCAGERRGPEFLNGGAATGKGTGGRARRGEGDGGRWRVDKSGAERYRNAVLLKDELATFGGHHDSAA